MKKLATGVIILACLLSTACGTTNSVTKITPSACPKVVLPDLPVEDQLPDVRTLVPGKSYTPSNVQVALPRSSWSLVELYNKSLRIWIETVAENISKHNEEIDKQMARKKDEATKRGWW